VGPTPHPKFHISRFVFIDPFEVTMAVQVAEHTRRKLNGRVVRIRADPPVSHAEPTPPLPPEQRCQLLLPSEIQAVSEAFKPLARIEREQRDVDDQQRDGGVLD
jgi:hypothetical protein